MEIILLVLVLLEVVGWCLVEWIGRVEGGEREVRDRDLIDSSWSSYTPHHICIYIRRKERGKREGTEKGEARSKCLLVAFIAVLNCTETPEFAALRLFCLLKKKRITASRLLSLIRHHPRSFRIIY